MWDYCPGSCRGTLATPVLYYMTLHFTPKLTDKQKQLVQNVLVKCMCDHRWSYACLIEAAPSLSCAGSSRGQYCIVTLLCSQPNWCRPQQRPVDADCCCHESMLEVLGRLSVQVVHQNIQSLNCIAKQTSLPLHSSPFSLPLSPLPLPPPVDRSESCFPSSTRPTRGLPRETQTKMRGL